MKKKIGKASFYAWITDMEEKTESCGTIVGVIDYRSEREELDLICRNIVSLLQHYLCDN